MKLNDINPAVVARAIKSLPREFGTRHVSEHPEMMAAHRRDGSYHAIVGRFLSSRNGIDGVPRLVKHGRTPAQQFWLNLDFDPGTSPDTTPEGDSSLAQPTQPAPATDDLGPVSSGDTPFAARMRLHQSQWRRDVLGVPYGVGPTRKSSRRWGNMLRPEDGKKGLNFLTPAIAAYVEQRLSRGTDRVEPYRLRHNLLSSQPMCFNLFAPLAMDHELAARLLPVLLGEPDGTPLLVDRVVIEHSPEPASEYLADRTSFDAFISYQRPNGGARGFVGIETKYTEPFSATMAYDGESYRRWMKPDGPWLPETWQQTSHIDHNQLWRDHLLAVAMVDHPTSPYDEGRLTLVSHDDDQNCRGVVRRYRGLLRDDQRTFGDCTLDQLLTAWERLAPEHAEWLNAFRRRYAVEKRSRREDS